MSAINPWAANSFGPTTVPRSCIGITPSNSEELSTMVRSIEATGAGTVACVMFDGSECVRTFAAGEVKHGLVKQVKATGTTATGLIGFI